MTDILLSEEELKSQYQFGSVIGRGSRGTVYKALCMKDGRVYAVKEVKIEESLKQSVQKELAIMKGIHHKHIIRLYDSFISASHLAYLQQKGQEYPQSHQSHKRQGSKQSLYLVMEYADSGELQRHIDSQRQKRVFFSEKFIWDVAWQLCLALLHLHSHDIVHRDVKCMNILMLDQTVKLGDLSESIALTNSKYAKSKRIGTPLYLSPDIIKHEPYDHRTDIWSLGVVLYHMAALEFPFMDGNFNNLMKQILYKQPKPFAACYSPNLKEFIFSMLEKSKSKRPFIIDLFKFFPHMNFKIRNEIDIENYEIYQQFRADMEKKRVIDSNKVEIKNSFQVLKQRLQNQNQMEKARREKSIIKRRGGDTMMMMHIKPKSNLEIQIRSQPYQTKQQPRETLNNSLQRNLTQPGNTTTRSEAHLGDTFSNFPIPRDEFSQDPLDALSPLQLAPKLSLPKVASSCIPQHSLQEESSRYDREKKLQQFIEQRTSIAFARKKSRLQEDSLVAPPVEVRSGTVKDSEASYASGRRLPMLSGCGVAAVEKRQRGCSNMHKVVSNIAEYSLRSGQQQEEQAPVVSIENKLKFLRNMNRKAKKITIRSISSKQIFEGEAAENSGKHQEQKMAYSIKNLINGTQIQ